MKTERLTQGSYFVIVKKIANVPVNLDPMVTILLHDVSDDAAIYVRPP